jgi:hypothetical protein
VLRDDLPDAEVGELLHRLFEDVPVDAVMATALDLDAGLGQLHDVRVAVDGWARLAPLTLDSYSLGLAAHELAANALLHGSAPIRLLLAANADENVVAVHDGSHVIPPSSEAEFHGMWILSRLTGGRLDVIPVGDDGKWVVASFVNH